jgi:hypothetical protein
VARVGASPDGAPLALPASFVDDLIFVRPVTRDGHSLRLFTDSGGGSQALYEDAVRRLGAPVYLLSDADEPLSTTPIPDWRPDKAIPPPRAIHQPTALQRNFLTVARDADAPLDVDGYLGQGWFSGRVWTIDYLRQRLLWRAKGDVPQHTPLDEVLLHFPKAADGLPIASFARITIRVEGEPVDLLFDTGATLTLSPAGLSAMGDGRGTSRGTSFLAGSLFDRWRTRHPEWAVIEGAERNTGAPILRVPLVVIGRSAVGPVWFTRRADETFRQYMSSFMDAPVEGALGGSALRYFRITVDYPGARAVFETE